MPSTKLFSVARARSRRIGTALLVVLAAEACTQWVPANEPVAQVVKRDPSKSIRVHLGNGSVVQMAEARIVGDSLFGMYTATRPVHVALADIKSVEMSKLTVGPVVTTVVVIGIVALAISLLADDGRAPPPPPPSTTGTTFSCPLVYTWDGHGWRLDSGTYGGAIMRALQRTDADNLDFAKPEQGLLRMKVANELNETDHVDALHVLAVDHDSTVSVAPDASGKLHTFGALASPVRAVDFSGRDALARVQANDGWNWESIPTGRTQARATDIRDGVELTFVRPAGAKSAHLVLDGNNTPWAAQLLGEFVAAHGSATQAWYDSLNANPKVAAAVGAHLAREAFLSVAVNTESGWTPQGLYWEAGPEVIKRQALDLDLSNVRGDTVRVRLESVPSFWFIDRVSMDFTTDRPITITDLELTSARDQRGADVRPLITAIDNKYYSLETGDAAELLFRVPDAQQGKARSFILRSTGWYHINTPVTDAPDVVTLHRVATEPMGLSRVAVEKLNAVIQRQERGNR